MVLVLDIVPAKKDYVKIITITSTLKDDGEYVPISPTPKKGYAIQIRLRNRLEWYHRDAVLRITMLPLLSYLKIDSYYEVPIQMLDEAVDGIGEPLMIWANIEEGWESFGITFDIVISFAKEKSYVRWWMMHTLWKSMVFDKSCCCKVLKGAGVCFDEVLGMDGCLQIGVSLWYLGDA